MSNELAGWPFHREIEAAVNKMPRNLERALWACLIAAMSVGFWSLLCTEPNLRAPSRVARQLVLAACRQWPFVKRQQPPGKELLDFTSIRYDARRGVLLDTTLGTELSVFALRSMYSCKEIEVLHAENRRHVVALCGQVFVSDDRARKVLHFGPRELWEKDPELFLRFVREPAADVPAPEVGGRGGLP